MTASPPAAWQAQSLKASRGAALGAGSDGLVQRCSTQRAQAELKRDALIGPGISTVSIVCNVIEGEDEAIVNITGADLRLIDFTHLQIVAHAAHQDPVLRHLQLRRA